MLKTLRADVRAKAGFGEQDHRLIVISRAAAALPCAMLANGPAWTTPGVFRVWAGWAAGIFINTVFAPAARLRQ